MKYFLDNNVSPAFEGVLRALEVDVVHIKNVEGLRQNAPDTVWIPVVGQNGWTAIGGDGKILTRPQEIACVREHGLVYFIFDRQFPRMKRWDQVLVLVKAWPNIEELSEGAKPGTCFSIASSNGKVKKIDP